jgi:hypothetical protein
MTYPRHALTGAIPAPASSQWTVRHRSIPRREPRPVRSFAVQWIDRSGRHDDFVRLAPAMPLFESAFSALGRGTLIPTAQGPVAIEDLLPGALVETTSGMAPLVWVGMMTIVPDSAAQGISPLRLYRVTTDAFGLNRPMPDLLLGPGARLLNRSPAVRSQHGCAAILEPIAPKADGMSVIEITPVSAVQVYHIGFLSHRTFVANGVEVESMHPGAVNSNRIDPGLMKTWLSMFPHIRHSGDFGPLCHPRIADDSRDSVHAA